MAAARAAARDRVLREFESTQSSLGNGPAPAGASAGSEGRDGGAAGDGAPRGTKRSFQLDEDEIERLTNEATEKALRKTTQEMADARKAKLPNYWLVSHPAPQFSFADPTNSSPPRRGLFPPPPAAFSHTLRDSRNGHRRQAANSLPGLQAPASDQPQISHRGQVHRGAARQGQPRRTGHLLSVVSEDDHEQCQVLRSVGAVSYGCGNSF